MDAPDCSPVELAIRLQKLWSLEDRKELCKNLIDGFGKSTVKPSTAVKSSGSGTGRKQEQKDAGVAEVAAPFQD